MTHPAENRRRPVLELVREALARARNGLDLVDLVELGTNDGWPEEDVRNVIAGLVTLGEVELEEVYPERRRRRSPFETWTRARLAPRT